MSADAYLNQLASTGRYHFTTQDAIDTLGISPDAARAQLKRLKQRGRIASPQRSFHVIVPPEYQRLGCLPAEHFISPLMAYLKLPYYVGLLSAAARHGAGHQSPQATQVVVQKNRKPIECGQVRIVFVARADLEAMPVAELVTPLGVIRYSTPEVTALELVGYPQHGGGLSNVATVLQELSEVMAGGNLEHAAKLCPVSWAQRLGDLLELIEERELAQALLPTVESRALSFTPLRRAKGIAGAAANTKWRVYVNTEVDPDL